MPCGCGRGRKNSDKPILQLLKEWAEIELTESELKLNSQSELKSNSWSELNSNLRKANWNRTSRGRTEIELTERELKSNSRSELNSNSRKANWIRTHRKRTEIELAESELKSNSQKTNWNPTHGKRTVSNSRSELNSNSRKANWNRTHGERTEIELTDRELKLNSRSELNSNSRKATEFKLTESELKSNSQRANCNRTHREWTEIELTENMLKKTGLAACHPQGKRGAKVKPSLCHGEAVDQAAARWEIEHYHMNRHHEVVLVGTSVGLPPRLQEPLGSCSWQVLAKYIGRQIVCVWWSLCYKCRATTRPGYGSWYFVRTCGEKKRQNKTHQQKKMRD